MLVRSAVHASTSCALTTISDSPHAPDLEYQPQKPARMNTETQNLVPMIQIVRFYAHTINTIDRNMYVACSINCTTSSEGGGRIVKICTICTPAYTIQSHYKPPTPKDCQRRYYHHHHHHLSTAAKLLCCLTLHILHSAHTRPATWTSLRVNQTPPVHVTPSNNHHVSHLLHIPLHAFTPSAYPRHHSHRRRSSCSLWIV